MYVLRARLSATRWCHSKRDPPTATTRPPPRRYRLLWTSDFGLARRAPTTTHLENAGSARANGSERTHEHARDTHTKTHREHSSHTTDDTRRDAGTRVPSRTPSLDDVHRGTPPHGHCSYAPDAHACRTIGIADAARHTPDIRQTYARHVRENARSTLDDETSRRRGRGGGREASRVRSRRLLR